MRAIIKDILSKKELNKEDLIALLNSDNSSTDLIYKKAAEIKSKYSGNITYFRGLIEYSNKCVKNCYYCGIRKDNKCASRYTLTDEEVISSAKYALDRNWGSVVIQAGELQGTAFTNKIEHLLNEICKLSTETPGITLSLGEQSDETLKRWYNAGAKRYLLRIESSNKELYYKLHPNDKTHSYDIRLQALKDLKRLNFMTGTGVMIGLPFQTTEHLADDLLFMRELDIDMCGMGPYIEHSETPLYKHKEHLLPVESRFELSLKMIAILRIIMKDINIASATALQAIDPKGREKGIEVGANVLMPNITPLKYHENYHLYKGKPQIIAETDEYINALVKQIENAGDKVGFGMKGDPIHFGKRIK
jgi:biotin synthase